MIIKHYKDEVETEYDVEVVFGNASNFQFKSTEFPPPSFGSNFVSEDGVQLNIKEQGMKVEEGKAMFYFLASPLPI